MFRRCMTPTRWVGKGNCFSGGSEADLNSILDEESTVPILAEIVGATHLPALSNASLPDPYCVVRVGDKVVHETAELNDEDNPIWTVKTRSLCILSIPDPSSIGGSDEVPEAEEVSEESSTPESITDKINEKECVVVEICSGKQCLGKVSVPFQHVLKGQGEREEFPIIESTNKGKDNDNNKVTLANQEERVLALRFREASTDDILFIQHRRQHSATAVIGRQLSKNVITPVSRSLSNVTCNVPSETEYDEIATDLDFQKVNKKSLLASYRKKDPKTGESLLRLQPPKPNSDPEDPATEEMAWMSKAQIKTEALKPSTNWIEAGNGEAGTLYLEIIGCDNLPNMVSIKTVLKSNGC